MDQLLAIKAFSGVVEAGNFTKASQSLRMPKATISKLVQALEAHLGVQLLSRTTRRVAVTAEGASYYEKSSRLLKELEDVDASYSSAKGKLRGQLRVSVGSSVASQLLIPALPSFLDHYPDVRIDVSVSDRPVDLVADNVDCVIRGGALAETALVSRVIGRASFVTCATPAYVARFGAPRHPRDLEKNQRVINYLSAHTGGPLPLRFVDKRRTLSITPRHVVGVNESNAHFAAGLAGLGVMQTFAFLAQPAIERGELVVLLTRFQPPPYQFHLAYSPTRHMSTRLRVFIDWLAQSFSERSR